LRVRSGREGSYFAITAPQLERAVVGFASYMRRVHIVIRLDFALAVDLLRIRIDEAQAIQDHLGNPPLWRTESTRCRDLVSNSSAALARAAPHG
jgi:hypothetical protein